MRKYIVTLAYFKVTEAGAYSKSAQPTGPPANRKSEVCQT